MGEVIYFVSNGRKAYVRGKDVGENLIEMINKIIGNQDASIDALLMGLQDHILQMAEFFKKINKEDKIELLQDKATMIQLACQGCSWVNDVRKKIMTIFTNPQSEGICCMSSHKSKGLQNPRVVGLEAQTSFKDDWKCPRKTGRGVVNGVSVTLLSRGLKKNFIGWKMMGNCGTVQVEYRAKVFHTLLKC